MKQAKGQCLDLEDPLETIRTGTDGFVDATSFFPLFDKYIYALCNDEESVRYATRSVLRDFEADGVRHLEIRTTPRACTESNLTAEEYVRIVNDEVVEWNIQHGEQLEVFLVLSVDRRMTKEQAKGVVKSALTYHYPDIDRARVVGVDLCGNPAKGDVAAFKSTFQVAKDLGMGLTVHFAEIPQSSTDEELDTILSWEPDRLGHCIHVSRKFEDIIKERCLGLELCLSCNVLTGLTTGGYGQHHIKEWLESHCPIALSTDDVGIFGSALSNEYLLAAQHFDLSTHDLIRLCRQAVEVSFAGKERMIKIIDDFEAGLIAD